MLEALSDPHAWISLATLAVLEVVLGVDNIIFLSIASNQLPTERRRAGRRIGLSLALVMRIALLTGVAEIIGLSKSVITIGGLGFSWRDIVFLAGGLFLLTKGSREIHGMVEGEEEQRQARAASFVGIIAQIAIFDLVFSIDSVVTAVGMAEHLWIMVTAVVFAMLLMLAASGPVSEFIHRNPTVKMLALSFLLLIGMALIADGMHFHIPRGYLYFAVAFSGIVEALNQFAARAKRKRISNP
jgi:predicted tellurium resistance membrane protein TerC